MTQTAIAALLKQRMGLDAASIGMATLERAVRLRMAQCGTQQVEDYAAHLQDSPDELQALIETVVVPETWFFRDRQAYVAMADLVMTQWLPAHLNGVLRLLSVPCSTGEEPYSMAMALLDSGLSPRHFLVDAVDISRPALAAAEHAEYRANSFRGEDLSFRERYFRPAHNVYRLNEVVRKQVRFQQSNLLAPQFQVGQEPYDIVFCRNLLIYFDHATQQQVMRTIHRLLAPHGVVFVGSAEAFAMTGNGFASARYPMAFAYRKTDAPTPATAPFPAALLQHQKAQATIRGKPTDKEKPNSIAPPISRQLARSSAQPAKAAKAAPAPASVSQPAKDLKAAQRLADTGQLAQAAEACEVHLGEQGPSVPAYYLLGLVRDAQGDAQQAALCYRKVLYLEPDHQEALLHIALLAEKQGDLAAARRWKARLRRVEERGTP